MGNDNIELGIKWYSVANLRNYVKKFIKNNDIINNFRCHLKIRDVYMEFTNNIYANDRRDEILFIKKNKSVSYLNYPVTNDSLVINSANHGIYQIDLITFKVTRIFFGVLSEDEIDLYGVE